MSHLAIRVHKISKEYQIGARPESYQTFRDAITATVKKPFNRIQALLRGQVYGAADLNESIWALRDVSFEVHHGEVIGVIGRNGAGKSTLLKVLSNITRPTQGRVDLYGRVGSLLEVGTGFHPELTGRENIYLNGSILGMTRLEINRKFDEIINFSGVEKFIDTPTKHYSTGMKLRLGFSVAAHLEPEILLVDEVLAVGDYEFQQKCMNKMQDVGEAGRTVLLVSHNMAAITRLCSRTILIENGTIAMDDDSPKVVDQYISGGRGVIAERVWEDEQTAPHTREIRLYAVRVYANPGDTNAVFDIRHPIHVEIEYDVLQAGKHWTPFFICYNDNGVPLFQSGPYSHEQVYEQNTEFVGRRIARTQIPGNLMSEGFFTLTMGVSTILGKRKYDINEPSILRFQVTDSHELDSARGVFSGNFHRSVMRPYLKWATEERVTLRKEF